MPASRALAGAPKNGISPATSDRPDARPSFSIAAVRRGRIDLSGERLKAVDLSAAGAEPYLVDRGDVLVVRGNANPNLVGKCGIIDDHPPGCIYPDILMRIRFRSGDGSLESRLGVLLWNHPVVHNQLLRRAKTSDGTPKINSRDVKQVSMPVPPKPAQLSFLKLINAADRRLRADRQRLAALRRLKTALSQSLLTGRVRVPVPQTPPAKTDR